MPELPEVETARRGIEEQLAGRRVTGYQLWTPDLIIPAPGLTLDQLIGSRLTGIDRHGKYLTLHFEPFSAVVHLKLAGQLVARGNGIPGFAAGHPVPDYSAPLPHKSTRLRLDFGEDAHLYLTDIRRFARVWLLPHEMEREYLAGLKLGPDLLSPAFTVAALQERLRRRTVGKLKPVLLDQSVVAGLGNIYVDESLWHARLHPERVAGSLSEEEIERLYTGINQIIAAAVPMGGARILHNKALTELGEIPFVHAREGLPCPRCGTTIVKTRVNNRGTYLCPNCQPIPD
jgi:formamidopyrimidine-DNA glycosylase